MALLDDYVRRGWKLVPIPKGKKAPSGASAKGWQTKYITDPKAIGDGNVGILLGEPSGWLIDVDLDAPEAVGMASYFLPDTKSVFGREGNPSSHYLYTVLSARTRKYQIGKKDEGGMLVELRSTGGQTVFPPSIHPSGEEIKWEFNDRPAAVGFDDLDKACGQLAAAVVLVKHWEDGSRQDLSFAIAGLMLKAEIDPDFIIEFISIVAEEAGDDEISKRKEVVQRTAKKIENDEVVAGYMLLAEILGEQNAKAIIRFLKISSSADIPEGAILITGVASKDLAKLAWNKIIEDETGEPTLFSFGDEISRIDNSIQVLTEKGFWQELASRTDWVKRIGERIVPTDPTASCVTFMRNQRKTEVPLPILEGSTNTPIMTMDGTIHIDPGYNADSKFYLFPTIEVPQIAVKPKQSELKSAKNLLNEVLVDFPFVHESDKAHALAMIILPFVRPMINGSTPLHLLDKPTQGTGATLLAEIATLIKTGSTLAAQSAPRNEEEWQKVILSKLIQAPEFLFLDNVRTIYSDTLAVALTAPVYEGRRLGYTEMVRVPIKCTWIMTGNNVEMGGDFVRRIIQIRLDANVADPSQRSNFQHPDLHSWVIKERGKLVWAVLTAARAWIVKGQPESGKELASYNHWAHVIGGILQMLDQPGFLETPQERKANIDPFMDIQQDFIRCWFYHATINKANSVMRSGELLNMCDACELAFSKSSNGQEMNTMVFSKNRMSKIIDKVFNIHLITGGLVSVKVIRSTKTGNGAWEIQPVEEVKAIDPDSIWQGLVWQ